MIRPVLLVVACASLALTIERELRLPPPPGASSPAAPMLLATSPPIPARTPDRLADILARPLFSADRRPPADPVSPPSVSAPDAPTPLPRLLGTIVQPGGRSVALLQPTPDAHQIALREGQTLGSLTLTAIHPSAILLTGPSGQRSEIRLGLAAAAPPQPPSAAPLPDPREHAPGEQDE